MQRTSSVKKHTRSVKETVFSTCLESVSVYILAFCVVQCGYPGMISMNL